MKTLPGFLASQSDRIIMVSSAPVIQLSGTSRVNTRFLFNEFYYRFHSVTVILRSWRVWLTRIRAERGFLY